MPRITEFGPPDSQVHVFTVISHGPTEQYSELGVIIFIYSQRSTYSDW